MVLMTAWLYPLGVVTFSDNLLFIGRFDAKGAMNTSYDSETYRTSSIAKPSPEYDHWMKEDIAYWRFVETEDVELAVNAQKGFKSGVLGLGRLHSVEGMYSTSFGRGSPLSRVEKPPADLHSSRTEHAVKWYLDKVKDILVGHAESEKAKGRNIDFAIPKVQSDAAEQDELCRLVGPEYEW